MWRICFLQMTLTTTCLALMLAAVGASPAAACSPRLPDWWFTEQFAFGAGALPPNVTYASVVISHYGAGGRGFLEISNQSAIPLYLLARSDKPQEAIESLPVALPQGMIPAYKIGTGEKVTLGVENLAKLASGIQDHNQQANQRPAQVQVPGAQSAPLTLVYGDRVVEAPLTLSYTLNTTYANKSGDCAAVGLFLLPLLLLGALAKGGPFICGAALLGAVGWVAWRRWRNAERGK